MSAERGLSISWLLECFVQSGLTSSLPELPGSVFKDIIWLSPCRSAEPTDLSEFLYLLRFAGRFYFIVIGFLFFNKESGLSFVPTLPVSFGCWRISVERLDRIKEWTNTKKITGWEGARTFENLHETAPGPMLWPTDLLLYIQRKPRNKYMY